MLLIICKEGVVQELLKSIHKPSYQWMVRADGINCETYMSLKQSKSDIKEWKDSIFKNPYR